MQDLFYTVLAFFLTFYTMPYTLQNFQYSRKTRLERFQEEVGLSFQSLDLLNLAFIHKSYANEKTSFANQKNVYNERLEFLGDAVLDLIIAEYLYTIMLLSPEGDLARARSAIVCEDSLSEVAREMKLGSCLLLGKGEEAGGGREKNALLADTFEALVGALYLDSGLEKTRLFILSSMQDRIRKVLTKKAGKDYKSTLQEYVQKEYKKTPEYKLHSESGPDHDKSFFIEVLVNDQSFGPIKGKNKKEAEQGVAKLACDFFKLL